METTDHSFYEADGKPVYASTGEDLKRLWNEWQRKPYTDEYGVVVEPELEDIVEAVNWKDVKEEFRNLQPKEVKSYHLINYERPVMFFYGKKRRHHRLIDKADDHYVCEVDITALVEAVKKNSSAALAEFKPEAKITIGDMIYAEWERMKKDGEEAKVKWQQENWGMDVKTIQAPEPGIVINIKPVPEQNNEI